MDAKRDEGKKIVAAPSRRERLAAELRANLLRRKAKSQSRRETATKEGQDREG